MYQAIGLMTPQSDFSLDEAVRHLQQRLPDHQVQLYDHRITVSHQGWTISIELESGESLRDEIEGLVDRLAGIEPDEADTYVASLRRLNVQSEDVDPFMEHFNTYLSVIEVLKSFSGVLMVDPKEPGVL
ncbi:MAG: hypothetical protein NZ703_08000 [Gemmataceae bacterium]|nr:hypothetical protein [Gemmataceae bacterium]